MTEAEKQTLDVINQVKDTNCFETCKSVENAKLQRQFGESLSELSK